MQLAFWLSISSQLYGAGFLALLDLVLGVALSLVNKEFKWDKLTAYLSSNFLPILAWAGIEYVLFLLPDLPAGIDATISTTIYGTIVLKIFASVLGHLSRMGIMQSTFAKVGIEPTGKDVETSSATATVSSPQNTETKVDVQVQVTQDEKEDVG